MKDELDDLYKLKKHFDYVRSEVKRDSPSKYNHRYVYNGGVKLDEHTNIEGSFFHEDIDGKVEFVTSGVGRKVQLHLTHSFEEIERALDDRRY